MNPTCQHVGCTEEPIRLEDRPDGCPVYMRLCVEHQQQAEALLERSMLAATCPGWPCPCQGMTFSAHGEWVAWHERNGRAEFSDELRAAARSAVARKATQPVEEWARGVAAQEVEAGTAIDRALNAGLLSTATSSPGASCPHCGKTDNTEGGHTCPGPSSPEARDDVFHDAMLAACSVASRCADEDAAHGIGRATLLGAVRVIRTLAEMRGLKCQVCGKPPVPEDRGGGIVSFQCECGFTESGPSAPPKAGPT